VLEEIVILAYKKIKGEMTQALYAHMNNKTIKKKKIKGVK
jgi:hypothetical protein